MPRLRIWKSNLERARDRCDLTREEIEQVDRLIGSNTGEIPLDVQDLPLPVARALLDDGKLKPNERAVLALRVRGMSAGEFDVEGLYVTVVSGPIEFASILTAANRTQPNAELQWNGRWYPVVVLARLQEEDRLVKRASVEVRLGLGEQMLTYGRPVDPALFLNSDGSPAERTVLEVLDRLGFRRLQINAAAYNVRLVSAERLGAEAGRQVWVRSSVLELSRRFFGPGLSEVAARRRRRDAPWSSRPSPTPRKAAGSTRAATTTAGGARTSAGSRWCASFPWT
jgi:hypothetical protein